MTRGEVLQSGTPARSELWSITGAAPADEQWDRLGRITADRLHDPDIQVALADYAADASTGAASIVRMRALDLGLSALAVAFDATGDVQNFTPAQRELFEQAVYLIPELFIRPHREEASAVDSCEQSAYAGTSTYIVAALCDQAGLDASKVFAARGVSTHNSRIVTTSIPVAPVMLMNHLVDEGMPSGRYLSHGVLRDAAELALNFRGPAYQNATNWKEEPTERLPLFTRLGRLTREGGVEHASPVDTLYELPDNQAVPYALVLNRLYGAARKLTSALPFPEYVTPRDAIRGTQRLIANALFGLQYYVEHGNGIDTAIGWKDGSWYKVQEDNPLFLLESLTRTLHMIGNAYVNFVPEPGPSNDTFHQYRLIDPSADTPPQLTYFGRAVRGKHFDPHYEFKGDATARFRVQHHTDGPIPFENALQTHDTVCVRADYDQFGFAIDVGGLPANPYTDAGERDLEVRIARFMALGNFCLSTRLGLNPSMHHARLLPPGERTEHAFRRAVDARHMEYAQRAAGIPRKPWLLASNDPGALSVFDALDRAVGRYAELPQV